MAFPTAVSVAPTHNKTPIDRTHGIIIFNSESYSSVSCYVDVHDKPMVVRAYNLSEGEIVTVLQVSVDGFFEVPLSIDGKLLQLTKGNNVLVLGVTGRYKFELNQGVGGVTVIGHESSIPYFGYNINR